MSDHLPECPADESKAGALTGLCICDRLRACEQRVREDEYQRCSKDRELHVQDVRRATLQAARDAVAALPVALTVVYDTPFLNKQGMGVCEDPDKYPHGIVQVAALAAIDALRGDA